MKIIKNPWDEIAACECDFGSYIFENSTARIYVHGGLDVALDMSPLFCKKNDIGFVGHCILVFCDIKKFEFAVHPYTRENGKPIWGNSIISRHEGQVKGETQTYELAGGLHGFLAYVTVEVEAKSFEIHVLSRDEPLGRPNTYKWLT